MLSNLPVTKRRKDRRPLANTILKNFVPKILVPPHLSTHSPDPVSGFFLSELFAIKFLPTFLFGLWWRRDPGQITAQPPPVKRSRGKCTALRIVFGFKWYWSNNLIFKVGAIDLKVQIPAEYFSRSGTPWFMVSLQGWRRFRDHGKRGECHPSTRIINLISKHYGDDTCWFDSEAFYYKRRRAKSSWNRNHSIRHLHA